MLYNKVYYIYIKWLRVLFIGFLTIFFCSNFSFAETEEITLSTYYPEPYGEYEDLCAKTLQVGSINNVPPLASMVHMEGIGIADYDEDANGDPDPAQYILASGDVYFNGDNKQMRVYDGTDWIGVGESLWALHSNGTDIYRDTGDVGIGTDVPLDRLHVAGSILIDVVGNPSVHFQDDDQVYTLQTLGETNSFRLFDNTHNQDRIVVTDTGNVGIGTDNPTAKLAVSGGNVVFSGNFSTAPALSVPISGAGSRLMWLQQQAAFRVGSVTGSQWDSANIGTYSTGIGYNTIANGSWATAIGVGAEASGTSSVAIGPHTKSSGSNTVAIGSGAESTVNYAIAMGDRAKATGNWSVAIGLYSEATNEYAFAMGQRAKATHAGSFVWADDSADAYFSSNGNNTFNIRASGGIYFKGGMPGISNMKYTSCDVAEFMDTLKEDKIKEAEIVSIIDEGLLGRSSKPYDENMLGIISGEKTCSFYMGDPDSKDEDIKRLPIALAGPVYIKVCAEKGVIAIGDPITSSFIPGVGMKADVSGRIIGYAMENEDFTKFEKDEKDGVKEILIFVNLGYYVTDGDFGKLRRFSELERRIRRLEYKVF
ncbi:MAG: hypothetical protein ABIB11_03230 [Candidatus Omnitrophota bacterium]